jgi:hypothetical protein
MVILGFSGFWPEPARRFNARFKGPEGARRVARSVRSDAELMFARKGAVCADADRLAVGPGK